MDPKLKRCDPTRSQADHQLDRHLSPLELQLLGPQEFRKDYKFDVVLTVATIGEDLCSGHEECQQDLDPFFFGHASANSMRACREWAQEFASRSQTTTDLRRLSANLRPEG